MITQGFCDYLEWHLTAPLEKSNDINLRRCWCDGVLMPDNKHDYSIETVMHTKKLITKAWIDEGRTKGRELGQRLYHLTIHFGTKSLKRYIQGQDFTDCIPSIEDEGWLMFDFENKEIEIQLF
jgi:hypothetical protein